MMPPGSPARDARTAAATCLLALAACGGDGPSGPAIPTKLAIVVPAAGAASGAPFSTQPSVALLDGKNRVVQLDGSPTVTMNVSAGATIIGSSTVSPVDGIATFTGVGIAGVAGTTYTLTFSSGTLQTATQAIVPQPGNATQLVLTTAASGAASGVAMLTQPVVSIRDFVGNVRTADNASVVTMSVNAGATIVGSSTATAANGVATFAATGLSGLAGAYTLTFALGPLSVTQPITLAVGPAARLEVDVAAADAETGLAFGRQPVIETYDSGGNLVATDNGATVTMSVSAGAATTGEVAATSVAGITTFSSAGVTGTPGGTYTLTFARPGLTSATQLVKLTDFDFVELDVGEDDTCGRGDNGKTYCWGDNEASQLGIGTTGNRGTPSEVVGGHAFVGVSVGQAIVCGRTAAGAAYCWGYANGTAIGDGTTTLSNTPVAVSGGLQFTAISAGGLHACGLTTTGAAHCWGDNNLRQLGDGTDVNRGSPVAVAGGHSFSSIAAGIYHTCALKANGEAWCWGNNSHGQLGFAAPFVTALPLQVEAPVGVTFASISVARTHTCALTPSGVPYCWGYNFSGQLGDGTTADRSAPTPVSGGHLFTEIAAGTSVSCGRESDGDVFCWGYNGEGSVGDGTTTARLVPTAVSGGHSFATIRSGNNHVCGIIATGGARCWGNNFFGQLGNASTATSSVPVTVLRP